MHRSFVWTADEIRKRVKPAGNGCLEWSGYRDANGYGMTSFRGRRERTHRISWVAFFGEIPPGAWVLHRCDNPPCVNPNHLYLGTQATNMIDCATRGRACSRVKPSDVAEIRSLLAGGMTQVEVALRFHISQSSVSRIALRQCWKNV